MFRVIFFARMFLVALWIFEILFFHDSFVLLYFIKTIYKPISKNALLSGADARFMPGFDCHISYFL
jgi:hypothetical protein